VAGCWLAKALEYFQKGLDIQLKALGPAHPSVGTAFKGMAIVYYKQGDCAKAVEYFQKALDITLKALGPAHPSVTELENIVRQLTAGKPA
jgi:tetratricopeptide (TPR) repeat protein